VPLAGNAPPGFVGVGDLGRLKGLTDQIPVGASRTPAFSQAASPVPCALGPPKKSPIRAAVRWSGVRQMNHSGPCRRPDLHRRHDADRKLAPANLAAGGTRAGQHRRLGDLETQPGKVEHWSGFNHRRFGQESTAGIAVWWGEMGFGAIRLRPLLERAPRMAFLSAVPVFSCLTQRLGLGFAQRL
jgi:hypothetical protein